MVNLLVEHVDNIRKFLKTNRLFRYEIACQQEIKLNLQSAFIRL
jgi:hypothetical protein